MERGRLELVTICAGALLAAHAGVLPGRRVTTHHHHLDELRRVEPRCEVVANRVFVIDPPLHSSAGVTTGIDLMLHRIADVCGEALAAQVAQTMVVALRRGPHDPELSPFLAYRNHLHPALHRVQDAVSEAPQGDWSVPRMAQVAHTSSRHLTRLFVEHAGVAPLEYLRRLRLATARPSWRASLPIPNCAAPGGSSVPRDRPRAGGSVPAPERAADAANLLVRFVLSKNRHLPARHACAGCSSSVFQSSRKGSKRP